jgi:hypothetical protein
MAKRLRVVTVDYDDTLLFHQWDPKRMVICDWRVNAGLVRKLRQMIAEGTKVYLVTARDPGLEDDTPIETPPYRFVQEQRLNISGLYYTCGEYKVDTLVKLGSELHFDDNEEELLMIQAKAPWIERVRISRPDDAPSQTRFEPNRITKKGAQKIRKSISDVSRVVLSDGPITEIRNVLQKPGRKPKGLWYGLGDEWLHFLEYNMPSRLRGYSYVYTIQPSSSVLHISDLEENFEELLEFTKRYGADYDAFSDIKCPAIDWKVVAKDYDGIEIIPFICGTGDLPAGEDCVFWYDGWDVASGCIWNPNGVSSLELVLDLSR